MKSNAQTPANASAELAEILNKKIPSDTVANALFRALSATTTTRAGTVDQDTRSQLQAAALILSYKVGRPVERSELVSVNIDAVSAVGLRERLASSPALRQSLRKLPDDFEMGGALDV